MRASLPFKVVLVVGFAVALAMPAAAVDRFPAGATPRTAIVLGGFDWLSQAWRWLWGLWLDAGPGGDPSGNGAPPAPGVRPTVGPGGDPNGHSGAPAPGLRPTVGPGGDPNGNGAPPAPGVRPTEGPGGDPNGHSATPAPRPAAGRGGHPGSRR